MYKAKLLLQRISFALRCHLLCTVCALGTRDAAAFPLVVKPGDTLAAIAQRVYGRVENERVLATANGLDRTAIGPIPPGTRLEVPALSYRIVARGDTWQQLATALLGAPERAAALALANGSKPWLPPAEGAEILVPYSLRFVVEQGDTLPAVAKRFFGSEKRAWMLAEYNGLKDERLAAGQVLSLPVTQLALTEAGREAARAGLQVWSGLGGERRERQAAAAEELPTLLADGRAGRYVEVVSRGVALVAGSELTFPQRAGVLRQLLEAYVALGAPGRAADACREWRRAAPQARLDPRELSPKLLAACASTP